MSRHRRKKPQLLKGFGLLCKSDELLLFSLPYRSLEKIQVGQEVLQFLRIFFTTDVSSTNNC